MEQLPEARVYEAEGGTVEEATAAACAEAGLELDSALVTVLSRGSLAVPGEHLATSRARVRVEPIPEAARTGRENLLRLLQLMDVEAEVIVRPLNEPQDGAGEPRDSTPVMLSVEGADLGVLIGWRGETLRALQTVVNLMLGPAEEPSHAPRLIVDVSGYRGRRERAVGEMARRLAQGVVRSGRPVTLDPMAPYERRAVHMALAEEAGVTTESTGLGAERRVTIRPVDGAQGGDGGRLGRTGQTRRNWR